MKGGGSGTDESTLQVVQSRGETECEGKKVCHDLKCESISCGG